MRLLYASLAPLLAACGLVLPLDATQARDAAEFDAPTYDSYVSDAALPDASWDAGVIDADSDDARADGGLDCTTPFPDKPRECPVPRLVAAGSTFTCVVVGLVDVYCFGENTFGMLATEDLSASVQAPSRVQFGLERPTTPIVDITAGTTHVCVLDEGGVATCWGRADGGRVLPFAFASPGALITRPSRVRDEEGTAIRFSTIRAGDRFTCGLDAAIGVGSTLLHCWGERSLARLGADLPGDGASYSTTNVLLDLRAHRFLAVGRAHGCVSNGEETVCWGDDSRLQLGDDVDAPRTPRVRPLLDGLRDLDAGGDTTCGFNAVHQLCCWGRGRDGLANWDAPVGPTCSPIDGRALVRVGATSAAMIEDTPMGTALRTLGRGFSGQLGDGSTPIGVAHSPARVSLSESAPYRLDLGDEHACAIDRNGDLHCWGRNDRGQVGVGEPSVGGVGKMELPAGALPQRLDAHGNTTCVTTEDREVYCVGANPDGALVDGHFASGVLTTPVEVSLGASGSAPDVHEVALGAGHLCGRNQRVVRCRGRNDFGQVGVEPTPPGETAFGSTTRDEITRLVAGDATTCMTSRTLDERHAECWGTNLRGQLGETPLSSGRSTPRPLFGVALRDVLAFGTNHGCASDITRRALSCWGEDESGQASGDEPALAPRVIAPPMDLTLPIVLDGDPVLALGPTHGCFAISEGTYCWGSDEFGQRSRVPEEPGLALSKSQFIEPLSLALGARHTCAWVANDPFLPRPDAVVCSGERVLGQLGTPWDAVEPPASSAPVSVDLTPGYVGVDGAPIAAGDAHTCVLAKSTGRTDVLCWGSNSHGQLGRSEVPTAIVAVPAVVEGPW